MSQMPEEGSKFSIVDDLWRAVMKSVGRNTNCLIATAVPRIVENLTEANRLLDEIQHGLNKYLEMKRLFFPRYVTFHSILIRIVLIVHSDSLFSDVLIAFLLNYVRHCSFSSLYAGVWGFAIR